MTAADRREAVVRAATEEFALAGLHGTAVDRIASRAGITQPYVFRLFGTKKDLFITVVERGLDTIREVMADAALGAEPGDELRVMGRAYSLSLASDRTLLLIQLHAYAACDDPDVRAAVRRGFARLHADVKRAAGAPAEELSRFFAIGMLLNVAAAMDMPAVDEPWSRDLLGPCGVELTAPEG